MLGRAVQRRRVIPRQPGHRRDHQHDALFVRAQQSADRDAGQFDGVGDVDVDFGVAGRFSVVPEIGPFLYYTWTFRTWFCWRGRGCFLLEGEKIDIQRGVAKGRGPYRLKYPGARHVDVRDVTEFVPRDGDEVLEIGPLRHVAFGEDGVFGSLQVRFCFGREAEIRNDAFGAVEGGELGEGEVYTLGVWLVIGSQIAFKDNGQFVGRLREYQTDPGYETGCLTA